MLLDSKKVGDMTWQCAAIDHGVTFYENGKIAPCCLIAHTYRKDITEIHNQPFKDLKTFGLTAILRRPLCLLLLLFIT